MRRSIAKQHVNDVLGRRLGVYREELKAWGDQWDYTRNVYKPEDLQNLRMRYPSTSAETRDFLTKSGVLRVEGKNEILNLDKAVDSKSKEEVTKFLLGDLNDTLYRFVKDAVTTPRSKFVKDAVDIDVYRNQQLAFATKGKITSTLNYLKYALPASLGAYFLYDEIRGK